MGKVVIMDHPLIQHKIGILRRKETGSKDFRTLISEIAMLMCYEATRDLKLKDVEIETPICKTTVKELAGKKLAVVPILRAGLGMVDGMLAMITARASISAGDFVCSNILSSHISSCFKLASFTSSELLSCPCECLDFGLICQRCLIIYRF